MASNGWENYKKRKGISVERAAAEGTESVSGWEQYKKNKARESQARNGALAVNPIKRGTYRSEVTAQYDPDDYKNERLTEEAYRIFAGEEAKTSSPGSVLQMGSGEYAAKPVDRRFVGPLETSEIWNPRSSINVGAGEYATRGRDWVAKDMGIPEDLLRGKTLKAPRIYDDEFIGPIGQYDEQEDLQERQRGLKMGNGEYATVTEGPGWKLNDMELFEDMLAGKTVTQPRTYDEGFIGPIGPYDTHDDIYARQRGLKMGNGEAAKLDPQMIGYDNLKNEPDFAEVLARPRNAEAEASNARELMGQVITNPGGVRKSIETAYMTGEEKNNYYYLSGKYGQEEAEKYYRSIEDKLNQRKGLAMYMNNQNLADWQRTAYEAAMPVLSGLEQTISGVAALGDLLTGDTQGRASSGLQYADMLLGEKLNEESGWKIPFTDTGWKKALHDAVQTTSAQAPQYLLGFAGAPMIGMGTLYASAFGNRYNQARSEGMSVGQSIALGVSTAAIEGLTEKLGGLAMGSDSTFVRKLLGDKLDDIANPILKALTATGLDAAGEGMEEAIAGVAEPIVEEYILTGQQDERGFIDKLVDGWRSIDWEDVRYQGLLGATSGGMMTGPMNVLQARMETPEVAIRAASESINNPENRMSQKLNATMIALKSGGIDDKTAATVAEPIVRMISGKKLGQSELELLAMTDGALDIAQDIAAVKPDKSAKKDAGQQPDGSNKVTTVTTVTTVTGDEPEPESEPVDAEVNRETAIEKAAKLGGERRIHEEIYDMGGGKQNAEAYGMEYERAYNRGRNSMALTDQVAKTYKTLTQEQVQAAWNAGRAQQEGIDQKKAQRAKSVTGAQGLVDARELEGTKLNANQRAAMRSAGYVAQALGVKVVWHKSQVSAEGKRTSPNGWYDPKDRSVHLDIYAGSNSESRGEMYRYAAMRTFAHELTHMIEDTSPQQYGELRAMVFDHLEKKGYSVEAMISEKQRAGQSRYTATQELVADACEMMLQDTDALKTEMARNPSLWERVKEAFGKFVKDLRKALEGIRPTSKEALALMEEAEGVLKYAEELQKKWDEALLSTVQEAGEDTNTSASEETAEQETETAENTTDMEEAEPETEQSAREPEQTAPEEEQREQLQRREGVTLMEERDWESIKDRSMHPFAVEVPEVREWFAMAAEVLQEDLAASTPGRKHFIRDEAGNLQEVTGQKRNTVDEIAQLLDHGMTYRDVGNALDAYAQIDMDWIGKHPQTAKKAELMLDQMLMEGYTNIEGERISGVADYRALTDELAGRETKEPVEYDMGEDIRYQPREEDQISDRELLATATESIGRNPKERKAIYEHQVRLMDMERKQKVADNMFKGMQKAGLSREAMIERQQQYQQITEEIEELDRQLLALEYDEVLQGFISRERSYIRMRTEEARKRAVQEYRERRNATEARAVMRRTIVTQTTRLRNRLESPRGGQYFIKDEMREYVSTLVKAFTPGADDGLFPEIELAQVQAAYKDMFKDNPNLAENYDENVEENLGELARILPGKKMAQMTMEQLRMLRDCMDHTMNLVTYGERVFAEERRQNVENWADPTIDKAGKDGKYLKQRWVEGVREFLNNGNATPVYFFKRIGGPLERLYKEFEKGEAVYGQDLWEARVVQRNLQKKYNYEKWADQKDDVLKFTTTNGKQLEIDRETALALWATRERERRNPDDNVRHLEQGGFKMLRTDKWVKQGKKGRNFLNQKQEVGTELYRLSDIDNDKIANWLTAEQKGYATEMVRYLSTDIAEKGNAVSKILNGYSIFGEGFYFPYRTSADYRSKNLGAIENAMLKNMGFTKKVRKYAGNPIVIDSFTKVWEEHVNQMAMYHGMAIPQNTFWRVYNYVMPAGKDADGVDHEYESVRAAVKGAYGEGADKYIEQLMIDIYGGVKRTYGDSLGAKLASKFKRNAVTMSMSVVVQQYSSIARAWAVISPKYFASLQGDRFKAAKAEMLRYSATAKIKNMGRFDMNDGRSAVEWLEEKDYTGAGFVNRTKAFFTDAEMRERFYGYLPKLVDEKVWTQIWKAAKRETAEKTGLTGDALCKATAERFDQIIRETQVYDSVLVRSQLMRDKGGWATMVTSFMGEPTLSYNMFVETVRLAKNKEYKKAGAYLTAVEAAVVLNAVLKAIVTAYRDKDEDETYWEKFFAHIVGDLTGSVHNTKMGPVSVAIGGLTSPLLPFGNIPYVSDILEVFQGYDVTRNDMNVAADMYNAFTAAFSEEKSAGEKLRAWAKPFSALTAVPVSNIERDFMGILNLFINDKRELQDTTARGIKYAILAELGRKDTESAETERMLDAAIKGDTKTYESLRVHVSEDMGLTDKEITSAMKSRIRERYEEGGIDEKEAARLLEKYGGLADEKEDKLGAEREVRKWDVKAESGNNTLYGNIWNHIAQWDGPALKKEIKELKKLGVEDDQICDSVLRHFKEIYLNAGRTEKVDLKAHLITALTYMGDTSTKAKERIEKWEKEE